MKKYILFAGLLLAVNSVWGQVSLGYFPFNYNSVQITSNPDQLIFGDLRVETNNFITNLNTDAAIMVNLRREEVYNFYSGPGVSFNPLITEGNIVGGYFLTIGVRWMPIEKLRQLGIIFELSPMAFQDFNGGQLRSFLGVSYHFGK